MTPTQLSQDMRDFMGLFPDFITAPLLVPNPSSPSYARPKSTPFTFRSSVMSPMMEKSQKTQSFVFESGDVDIEITYKNNERIVGRVSSTAMSLASPVVSYFSVHFEGFGGAGLESICPSFII